uniref:Uncharacterized protein n=1 Tax=Hyaloperonospora arabidopsidis (strain Emoy2) TaxID=559515 RepID=M4BBY7_HYAAE
METRWQLSKECMFLVSAFFVLFMSGGLILGFGPVYSMLVQEKLWVHVCSKEEQQNRNEDSGVLCAAQEVYLQSVFSTAFLSLSASNVFFGVFLDVVGPRGTIVLALLLSTCGNFALAFVQAESSGSCFSGGRLARNAKTTRFVAACSAFRLGVAHICVYRWYIAKLAE